MSNAENTRAVKKAIWDAVGNGSIPHLTDVKSVRYDRVNDRIAIEVSASCGISNLGCMSRRWFSGPSGVKPIVSTSIDLASGVSMYTDEWRKLESAVQKLVSDTIGNGGYRSGPWIMPCKETHNRDDARVSAHFDALEAIEGKRMTGPEPWRSLAAFTPALADAGVTAVDKDGTAWLDDPSDRDGVRPERVEELLGRLLPPEVALDLDFREADIDYMGVVSYEPSSDTVLCSSGGPLRAKSRTECLLESYSDRIRGADNVEDLNEHLEVYLRHGGSMNAVEEAVQEVRKEAVEKAVGAVYAAEGPAELADRLNELQETLIACELRIQGVGDYVQPAMLPFEPPVRYGSRELRDADLVAVWSDGRAVKDTPDGYRETTVEAELGPRRSTFARAVASALDDRSARATERGPSAAGTAEAPQQGRKSGGLKL